MHQPPKPFQLQPILNQQPPAVAADYTPRGVVRFAHENHLRAKGVVGSAIDLGCGAGNDTLYLAERGWKVVAVDLRPDVLAGVASRIPAGIRERVELKEGDIASVQLPAADLIVACFSLPFVGQEKLLEAWAGIRAALRSGGRFSGHFFGFSEPFVKEGIAAGVDRTMLREMFRGFEVEYFSEELAPGPSCAGPEKLWHVYYVTAKLPEHLPVAPLVAPRLYHFAPRSIEGEFLMPLNQMRGSHPELFRRENSKYEGREFVQEQLIHGLNCLWNDVIHFLPFHPGKIREAYEDAGLSWSPAEVLEVDPVLLGMSSSNTVIYRMDPFSLPGESSVAAEFSPFSPEELSTLQELPPMTREYYRESAHRGTRPLVAHGVPHVLFRGVLPFRQLRSITV
jgi:SAM-dependent methyltransferase